MNRHPAAHDLEQVRADPDPRLRVVEPVTWGTVALVLLVTLVAAGVGGVALVWLAWRGHERQKAAITSTSSVAAF